MDAVDLWIAISAVLFGVAALFSLPRAANAYAMTLLAGGLLCFMIGTLVARN